jgi:membrane-bound lytic murein transglycosylase A
LFDRALLAGAAMLCLAGCVPPTNVTTPATLAPVGFDTLPGWSTDDAWSAVPALLRSCGGLADLPTGQPLGGAGDAARLAGTSAQWTGLCSGAEQLRPGDDAGARAFFERWFQPYALAVNGRSDALFTGYYEPEVAGSRRRGGAYQTPILALPTDIVQVSNPEGGKTIGRSSDGQIVPYYDRSQIVGGALDNRGLELFWLADPIDAFVLQIQGSGRIRLPNGAIARVGYAGQNGQTYVPIGRRLIERREMAADQVSMQSIRAWLVAHPDQAAALMNENPAYVFFRELPGLPTNEGAPGSFGVPLTPGRSLAVDRSLLPLGAPVFIETTDPVNAAPIQRLTMAQDTGGAIKGALRGDMYFGWGTEAEDRAGKMRQPGRAWLLLPRPGPSS